jgi:hypothetical protein
VHRASTCRFSRLPRGRGFLSFAEFEAAATLGGETREPNRNIPRAILGTAIFGAASCCPACLVGASRLIFALSRDGMGPKVLAKVHETPKGAARLRRRLCDGGGVRSSFGVDCVSDHTIQSVPDICDRGHADPLGYLRPRHRRRAEAALLQWRESRRDVGGGHPCSRFGLLGYTL